MYPEGLAKWQIAGYRAGHEEAPEHDRNGAFHWWLRQNPDKSTLMKLVELTFLDPDQIMAEDVRSFIAKSQNADADVIAYISRLHRSGDSLAAGAEEP